MVQREEQKSQNQFIQVYLGLFIDYLFSYISLEMSVSLLFIIVLAPKVKANTYCQKNNNTRVSVNSMTLVCYGSPLCQYMVWYGKIMS